MDYIAKGLYRELLDEQWVDGSIPADMSGLADICGCPVSIMTEKWPQIEPCFVKNEVTGRLYNLTLEAQRTTKDAQRIMRATHGGSGGSQKSFNLKLEQATEKKTLASASNCYEGASNCHIEEKSREEKSKDLKACSSEKHDERADDPQKDAQDKKKAELEIAKAKRLKNLNAWAERCHAAYPRKMAKQDSLRAFIKHVSKLAKDRKISDDSAGSYMLGRVEAYRDSPMVAATPADKIPYPATWANAGHYEDSDDAWQAPSVSRPAIKPFEPGINIGPSGDVSQAESDRAFIEFARSQRDKGVISAHDLAVLNRLENSNTAPN